MFKININSRIIIFKNLRKTLFQNLFNTIITLLIILFVSVAFFNTFEWLIFKANWKVVVSNLQSRLALLPLFSSLIKWSIAAWLYLVSVRLNSDLLSKAAQQPEVGMWDSVACGCVIPGRTSQRGGEVGRLRSVSHVVGPRQGSGFDGLGWVP